MKSLAKKVGILATVLLCATLAQLAIATISVSTKPQYYPGESVTISIVGPANKGIGIQVANPSGGIIFVGQIQTDGSGAGSITFTLAGDAPYGTYTIYAAGGGDSGQGTFEVVAPPPPPPAKKPSAIVMTVSPSSVVRGGEVEVKGSLSPALANEFIDLSYEHGASKTSKRMTTDITGSFTDKFVGGELGEWRVTAAWGGNNDYEGCSATVSFYVKIAANLTIALSKNMVLIGSSTTVNGRLSPPLDSQKINIYVSIDGTNYNPLFDAFTDPGGKYSYEWSPTRVGKYYLRAFWTGSASYFAASSPIVTLEVTQIITSMLEIQAEPVEVNLGKEVNLKGSLTPKIEGAEVSLGYSIDGGAWTPISAVKTDSAGKFSTKWKPPQVGTYAIRGTFAGFEAVAGSVASTVVIVRPNVFSVVLQIMDSKGSPLFGAVVSMRASPALSGVTGVDGKLTFIVPPGTYEVTAAWHGASVLSTRINVVENKTFTLLTKVYPLTVSVVDEKKQPAPGATVFVRLVDGTALYGTTGSDGKVTLAQVPEGTWEIESLRGKSTVSISGPGEAQVAAPAPSEVVPLWGWVVMAILLIIALVEFYEINRIRSELPPPPSPHTIC